MVGTLLDDPGLGLPIEMPDTAEVGQPFTVTVRTTGSGCERIGPTEVSVDAGIATVVPYDYTLSLRSGVICDAILKVFEHDATISLVQAGAGSLVVRAADGAGSVSEQVRDIWVR